MHKLIIILLVSLGSFHFASAQPTALLNNALDSSWTEPGYVIKDSSAQLPLFNITFAETDQGIYTFGNPLPNSMNFSMPAGHILYSGKERLIAVNPHRDRMSVPDGNFTFAYPVALSDSNGSIHLLWAEADSSAQEMSRYRTVWYARYTQGKWSEPAIVYQSESLDWDTTGKSNFIVDSGGVFHLLFPANQKNHGNTMSGFVHLYRDQNGWHHNFSARTQDFVFCGSYINLAVRNSGPLLMTCIGPGEKAGDTNNVYFRSSADKGQNWNEWVTVSRSGKKQAHYSKLLVTSDGTIHLLWLKSLSANFMPETIWHARSEDGGKSWSKPLDLNTRQPASHFEITADSNDRFHLVYSSLRQTQISTHYKMWDGDRWGTETGPLLPNQNTKLFSTILLTKNNRLHFVLNTFGSLQPPLPDNSLYFEKKLEK